MRGGEGEGGGGGGDGLVWQINFISLITVGDWLLFSADGLRANVAVPLGVGTGCTVLG